MITAEYGQIRIGPLELPVDKLKARISGNFMPDFTIDLKVPPKIGLLSVIKPKITLLYNNQAFEIGWGQKGIRKVDPSIFERDTFLDTIHKIGIIPTILIITGVGIITYKLITKKN